MKAKIGISNAMKTFLKKEEVKTDRIKFSYWHKGRNDFFILGYKKFNNFHLN